jgi:hypothetical protein
VNLGQPERCISGIYDEIHKLSGEASFVHHYVGRGDKKQFFPAV